MDDNPSLQRRPYVKIIAEFCSRKGYDFEDKSSRQHLIRRYARAAIGLANSGYTFDEILETMDYCQENWSENWELETVGKSMASVCSRV
jgi:hypothetical protein